MSDWDYLPVGGPAHTDEECRSCGREWIRYRLGSHDVDYVDCPDCKSKKFAEELMKSKK